ncbi:MAG: hypothetical protein J6K04_03215 [Lachnospiraceae bacterium]|nr:hypothetical protein [Lachnospiraceae bacterium]
MKTTKELLLWMMQRYDIGKKPLSRLLGWGETTVMRYLDGVEPNQEFFRRMEELAENPWRYARVLEQNKEKLTDTAYRKTKKAVYREIFCDRSTEAMQYVVALAEGDIAPYRVMTVLYYAQTCSVVLRGIPLFEEEADFSPGQAMIYPRLYQMMKQYGIRVFNPDISSFSTEEQEYLKQVYLVLNGYSPNALKALHAREKRRIRRHLKGSADRLSMEDLKGQYESSFRKSGVENPEDLKLYLADALKRTEN